jgi:hypothetical protein
MTENAEPQQPQPETTQALVPVAQTADKEYDRFARLGTWLAAAEGSSEPKGKDGMAAAARVAIAVESGWPWRAAFEIALVHNKPHISSALLRALAEAEGYRVQKVDSTDTECTAVVLDRNGHELGRATFTIDQAKRANLIKDKGAWTTYPERMLWARASGFAVMDAVPHVALGFSALETEDIITIEPGDVTEVDDQDEA